MDMIFDDASSLSMHFIQMLIVFILVEHAVRKIAQYLYGRIRYSNITRNKIFSLFILLHNFDPVFDH